MNLKRKYIFTITAIIAVLVASQFFAKERGKENFKKFNEAKIDTVLIFDADIFDKGSRIRLADGLEYIFYPVTDERINSNKLFYQTAKKGNKIFKEAYNDTLFLFQQDKILKYTFTKL